MTMEKKRLKLVMKGKAIFIKVKIDNTVVYTIGTPESISTSFGCRPTSVEEILERRLNKRYGDCAATIISEEEYSKDLADLSDRSNVIFLPHQVEIKKR